jgi:hopanoid C-3 methylase
MESLKVLLVSVYEGGYQPISIATATTPLLEAGFEVAVLDTYVDGVQEDRLYDAGLVAIALPLFDAVHPGIEVAKLVRQVNPAAHVTYFGQHATIHAARLTGKYGDSCISGEWEEPLVALARKVAGLPQEMLPGVVDLEKVESGEGLHPYMPRNHFRLPTRDLLPPLYKYPNQQIDKLLGAKQIVGSTEIARGCHHKCLYCSVFAAYDGKVILVPEELVVQDVRTLVAMGMTHLTFIDADFFNAKHHGIKILRRLHAEFPKLTYDITTRVDHILENPDAVREMDELGVRIITSALEFPSQVVLDAMNKEITLEQTERAIAFMKTTNIKLNPTFIMFNPWVGLEDLTLFNDFVQRNDLDEVIDPVQYETRLSLYKGSPLLQLPSVQALDLIENEFHVDWKHADPRVDELHAQSVTPAEEGVFKRCCLKC